jgi:diguanylate cyclase (GGDEF)-like protein
MSATYLAILVLLGGFSSGIVAAVAYFALTDSDEGGGAEEPGEVRSMPRESPEAPSLRETTEPATPETLKEKGTASGARNTPEVPSRTEGSTAPSDHRGQSTTSERTERISKEEIESLALGDTESEQAYLVVVSGNRVGEMVAVDGELVLGRDPDAADISFRDETVSSRHARLQRIADQTIIEDLESANGTFVNARQVEKGTLEDGDKITLGRTTVLKFTFQDELDEEFQQQMYESSTRDQLTRALSKTHFLDRMETELSYAKRHGTNICVILFDLDHFKEINDTFGHVAGDEILRVLGDIVRSITRDEALFARYGGEEFVVAERNAGIEDGAKIAERIRRTVQDRPFEVGGHTIDVTLSVGVADLRTVGSSSSPTDLLKKADEAMYLAKEAGRNRVKTTE